MCELFGYSGDREQHLGRWLTPFRRRGGGNADNPDGWGVASWHDGIVSLSKSSEPGFSSAQFACVAADLRSRLAIAHVRKARHPPVPGMLNTHPFLHACCNREWVFAHNGMVPDVIAWQDTGPLCLPDGETDSEYAFCHLLTGIAEVYENPQRPAWLARLAQLSEKISALGKFNFLLSDGQELIAYGHDRLHRLELDDESGRAVIVATEPLTDEPWQPFQAGELRVYRDGALIAQLGGRTPVAAAR
jgi:glutamine amidotransferase